MSWPPEGAPPARPQVSVVMPFAGDERAAQAAVDALLVLDLRPGDELILADNSGTAVARGGVAVIRATGERSPARARNAGAARAHGEWILFLDADCRAPSGLLDAYFAAPVAGDVGALAGEVVPLPGGDTLAARYGSARSFLSQQAHLNHPYRPRAVAANLLVRRAAFEQIGGFYEGVRGRGRGWAAGRAWLARRYEGFAPEPAVARAVGRLRHRGRLAIGPGDPGAGPPRSAARGAPPAESAGRLERGGYLALDALLSAEELAGLALSNRPSGRQRTPADVVVVADRFPVRGDPRVEFVRALGHARVEAIARPELPDGGLARELQIDYREDDGIAVRFGALLALAVLHPMRAGADLLARRSGEPGLSALAPAVLRLKRDRRARVHALGGEEIRATARRLARLAGRPLDENPRGR